MDDPKTLPAASPSDPPNAGPGSAETRRNQFGRTWAEEEQLVRQRLAPLLMTVKQIDEEVEKQHRMFNIYADVIAAPDGRREDLSRALAEAPPERHARIVEAARKAWS